MVGPSIHSRAARRATSPSIDTDKSLKTMKPPEESINHRPAVLAAHHSGGVTKKTKKGRKSMPSSRAKRRHEKGMDRAEAVMERTAKKLQKSKGQARTLVERSKTWDEINKDIPIELRGAKAARQPGQEDDEDDDAFVDTDEEMDALDEGTAPQAPQVASLGPQSVPLAQPLVDEDEIL